MKFFILVYITLLVSGNLYAAKVKSSQSYLKKVSSSLDAFSESFSKFKNTLSDINDPKSFVSTDFWGLKHGLYIHAPNEINTQYPFAKRWLRPWNNYEKYSSRYVRNINGVIFSPTSGIRGSDIPKSWFETLDIEFNFHPGYYSSENYKEHVLNYFTSNGITESQKNEALSYFGTLIDPATTLLVDKAYQKLDKVYKGIGKFGDVRILEKIAGNLEMKGQLDLDEFYTPIMHKKIYPLLMENSGGIEKTIQSYKALYCEYEDSYKDLDLWQFYQQFHFKLRVEVPVQYFEVAKGMSKSQKYNQLIKLQEMLDKKVSKGTVKRSVNGNYTVYEDALKYTHGRIGIDFKNGYGYWQDPFWADHKYITYDISKVNEATQNVNIALKNFLDICLKETVKKFKNSNAETDDF